MLLLDRFTNTQKWAPQNAWFESYDTKWVNLNLYCSWDRDYIEFVPASMFYLGIYGMRSTSDPKNILDEEKLLVLTVKEYFS